MIFKIVLITVTLSLKPTTRGRRCTAFRLLHSLFLRCNAGNFYLGSHNLIHHFTPFKRFKNIGHMVFMFWIFKLNLLDYLKSQWEKWMWTFTFRDPNRSPQSHSYLWHIAPLRFPPPTCSSSVLNQDWHFDTS